MAAGGDIGAGDDAAEKPSSLASSEGERPSSARAAARSRAGVDDFAPVSLSASVSESRSSDANSASWFAVVMSGTAAAVVAAAAGGGRTAPVRGRELADKPKRAASISSATANVTRRGGASPPPSDFCIAVSEERAVYLSCAPRSAMASLHATSDAPTSRQQTPGGRRGRSQSLVSGLIRIKSSRWRRGPPTDPQIRS